MASTLTSIRIHFVFSTKNRNNLIDPLVRPELWAYMGGIARQNNMVAYAIGGTGDHAHVLISMPPTISVAKTIQLIKGGSSKWMNDEHPQKEHFSWQQGYAAFTLSPSRMKQTINYIQSQEEHHKKVSFKEEYLNFLKGHSVEFDEKYILG
jgi:putative transposase